ncbi:hypothetical protein MKX01_004130 [Papaver californicum]|nr:hypothetical protein MKX01_004130 [Papaver californicum]
MGGEEEDYKEECCSTQLIDGDGEFNATGLENFMKTAKISECGLSYAVVAIMGPQSSGKSTLLNYLFRTNFKEMDAFKGRSQTTKGIWIAKCVGIEPCTIAMDLEGTDGRERGEDDTAFEKQSALFALAISDIVLINMWCHDIGREQAANKPLLKTVFQVMMRLFSPRKTTLLLVIRDKTKTPLEHLEPVLREDIQKIWDGVPKPEAHKDTPLSEFFNLEVTALSSYEEKEEQFKEQVEQLRKRFIHSIAPGGLAGDRRGVVPASGFSFSAQQIWKVIRDNKDLDLPAHKVMVATVRCEEIANEKLSHLTSDEQTDWDASKVSVKLRRDIEEQAVSVRSAKFSELITNYENQLTKALAEPIEYLFESAGGDTWALIRKLVQRETDTALSRFTTALNGFELDQETYDKMVQNLRDFANTVVEKKAREEAGKVLIHMKDRFSTLFSHDKDSMPRVWTGKENIRKITMDALTSALRLLSVMAAIRFDEKPDRIENLLFSSLMDGKVTPVDPLATSSWDEISSEETLLTPVQCKSLWRQFKTETEYIVAQAISAQEAHRRSSNNWIPPPWAILAMIILGFNEIMLLLKNPLYILLSFVVYLVAKALWLQLDIGEFCNSPVSALISVASRSLPNMMETMQRFSGGEQVHQHTEPPAPSSSLLGSQSFSRQQSNSKTSAVHADSSSAESNTSRCESSNERSKPTLSSSASSIERPSSTVTQRQAASAMLKLTICDRSFPTSG